MSHELFGDVISTYTRAQALEDGFLIDVSSVAKEAGIKYPVALTSGVWAECVTVPPRGHGQDEKGRLWDVVFLLRTAIRASRGGDRVDFTVKTGRRLVRLYALCGPGDEGEAVITVLLERED